MLTICLINMLCLLCVAQVLGIQGGLAYLLPLNPVLLPLCVAQVLGIQDCQARSQLATAVHQTSARTQVRMHAD